MYKSRFNDQVPHHQDTNLIERCQEQLRDYDIGYKGWVEPKNHTISYLAAAYLELAKKYEELIANKAGSMTIEELETVIFENQMQFGNNLAAQMEAIVEETYQDALRQADEE